MSVHPSVCVFTLSNMNISETNGSIATKFYLKHHLGGGLAAAVFHPILFILAGNEDMHESSDEFEFQPDWTTY